jgi:hypothetical protein
MTTNTVEGTISTPPVWDHCPPWCRQPEHPEQTFSDGSTYRVGDEWHDPHYSIAGGPFGISVAVERENNHLGDRARANAATTRVMVAACDKSVPFEVDDDGMVRLALAPSVARSLAAALVRAADLAEGVES